MAVFRQKGRKTWQARIYLGNGRRKSISTGTTVRAEAEAFEARLRAAVQGRYDRRRMHALLEDLLDEPGPGLRLGDVYQTHISIPGLEISKQEQKLRRYRWQSFVDWCEDCAPDLETVQEITRETAWQWWMHLQATDRSGKTLHNIQGSLTTVMNSLVTRGIISENPFSGLPGASTKDSKRGRPFTDDEVRRILDAADPPRRDACIIALYTGARYVDIAHMKWEDIDGTLWTVVPRKTDRHKITVHMFLHSAVQKVLARRRRRRSGNEYVFPELVRIYSSGRHDQDFTKILQKASINRKGAHVTFHCWRHTFRTRLAAAGVDRETAQALGGWVTEVSETIYNHDRTRARNAIQMLPLL